LKTPAGKPFRLAAARRAGEEVNAGRITYLGEVKGEALLYWVRRGALRWRALTSARRTRSASFAVFEGFSEAQKLLKEGDVLRE